MKIHKNKTRRGTAVASTVSAVQLARTHTHRVADNSKILLCVVEAETLYKMRQAWFRQKKKKKNTVAAAATDCAFCFMKN